MNLQKTVKICYHIDGYNNDFYNKMLKQKSDDNLRTAEWAINSPFHLYNVAMSRMYYAVFEVIKYYLFKDKTFFNTLGIKEDEFKHSKLVDFLKRYLNYKKIIPSSADMQFLSKIGQMIGNRIKADYSPCSSISKQTAEEYIQYAKSVICFMDRIG